LDEKLYPNPREFNAFRFARSENLHNVFSNIASKDDPSKKVKPKSSVTLDDSFLGFGFGKHACPGRFFALNEMKLFVAYLVQHYDIEHLKVRPKPVEFMWYKLPSDAATIRVRRREGA
jgi:cytochrome P450